MKAQPSRERQRMLDVLDARWSVGEAAKSGIALKLKVASLAAAGMLAVAVAAPWGGNCLR